MNGGKISKQKQKVTSRIVMFTAISLASSPEYGINTLGKGNPQFEKKVLLQKETIL